MKIGIIGVQSRHLDFFTEQINIEKRFADVSVVSVWGDDEPDRVGFVAKKFQIPTICRSADELIASCDTVFILPRNGYQHMDFARKSLLAKKSVFVDKAFAVNGDDAQELFDIAYRSGRAIAGGSTLCYLPEMQELTNASSVASITLISFSADRESPYGGWVYYGCHLTDLCSAMTDEDPHCVTAASNGKCVTAVVTYKSRQTILHSHPDNVNPEVIVLGDQPYQKTLDTRMCFRYGLENIINELKTNSKTSHKRLKTSAVLLEACLQSLSNGKTIYLKQ